MTGHFMTIQSCNNLKTGGLQPIKHFNPEVQMFSFIGSGTCTVSRSKKRKVGRTDLPGNTACKDAPMKKKKLPITQKFMKTK